MTAEPKRRTKSKAGKLITFETTATRPLFVYGKSLTPYLTLSLYKPPPDRVASECFRVCDAFILLLLLSHDPHICVTDGELWHTAAERLPQGYTRNLWLCSTSMGRPGHDPRPKPWGAGLSIPLSLDPAPPRDFGRCCE